MILVFLLLIFMTPIVRAEVPPHAVHDAILAQVNLISADSIYENILRLQNFQTRHTYSDTLSDSVGVGAAMRWVLAKAQNYDTHRRFHLAYFDYVQNWAGQPRSRSNLICSVNAHAQDSALFLIGAHLDSRAANLNDVTAFAPGADDNGSSCAALLELLRILPDTLRHHLEVIWFTGEEEGLWGSAAYANDLAAHSARVDGMIGMDMIAHIRNSAGNVDSNSMRLYAEGSNEQGGTASVSRNLERYVRWVGEAYGDSLDMRVIGLADRPGRGGDHLSFSAAGYAAVRVIETNEDVAYQHGPNDVIQNLSAEYARKIARATFGALLTMLSAPPRPPSPVLEWLSESALRVTISDSVVLPEDGRFFVSLRNFINADFDSIVDMGTHREFVFSGLLPSENYAFSISRADAQGLPSPFSKESASFEAAAELRNAALPKQLSLNVYPNPFNSEVCLSFDLPRAERVTLEIYDLLGRRAATLWNDRRTAGHFVVSWLPVHQASGIYLARLSSADQILTRKLLYLR